MGGFNHPRLSPVWGGFGQQGWSGHPLWGCWLQIFIIILGFISFLNINLFFYFFY
jgi:hypothetical protein